MVRYRTCSVQGCEDKRSSRHTFPNPDKYRQMFQKWLVACANSELYTLSPEFIYKSKKVCQMHFKKEDVISSNMLLRKDAVPVLFLPSSSTGVSVASPPCSDTGTDSTLYPIPNNDQDNIVDQVTIRKDLASVEHAILSTSGLSETISQGTNKHLASDEHAVLSTSGLSETISNKHLASVEHSVLSTSGSSETISQGTNKHLASFEHAVPSTSGLPTTISKGTNKRVHLVLQEVEVTKPESPMSKAQTRLMKRSIMQLKRRSYKLRRKLLDQMPVAAGVNETIFHKLKLNAAFLKSNKRFCILMFDEMAIEPRIVLNLREQRFEGFEDLDGTGTTRIADRAQIFLIKGITSEWKQPVAYTFSSNTICTIELVKIITNIIRKCKEAGLEVLATISDQGSTNQAAVDYLMKSSVTNYFEYPGHKFYFIDGQKIVHIYDPPNLLKGIRNNLLTKNLVWKSKEGTVIAKWSDIHTAYHIDIASSELRVMPKLTEGHCDPQKLNKKKVACVVQVFSHTVASVMNLLAKIGAKSVDGRVLHSSAIGTAKILKMFDNIFDSCNGHFFYSKGGKQLRCAVSSQSPHIAFWNEAKQHLNNMYFQKKGTYEKYVPPLLNNWIVTLNGIENLYDMLKTKDITILKPKVLNLDTLRNFDDQIRQHTTRTTNPTSVLFKLHFKTLYVNNLVGRHSISSSSEDEMSAIMSVKSFMIQRISEEVVPPHIQVPTKVFSFISNNSIGYVSSLIVRKIFKNLYSCDICKKNLLRKEELEWHMLVAEKELESSVLYKLKYCSPELIRGLCIAYNIIRFLLPKIATHRFAYRTIVQFLQDKVEFSFKYSGCGHNLKAQILPKFAFLVCSNWTKCINKIMSGRKTIIFGGDEILKEARRYYLTRHKK